MRLSKSKVLKYKQCPRSFRYTYIDELPRPTPEDDSPLTIGTEIHQIFEDFLSEVDLEWFNSLDSRRQLDMIREYDIDDKYKEHLENFIDFVNEFTEDGYRVVGCEPHFESQELNLHGYLDLVLEKDNKLVVIDYKTGKSKAITEYMLELTYYGLLAQKELDKQVDMVGIFFSKDGNLKLANFIEEPDRGAWISYDDIITAIAYLKDVEQKIENEEFRYKKGWLCDWCDFKKECEDEGYEEYGNWG